MWWFLHQQPSVLSCRNGRWRGRTTTHIHACLIPIIKWVKRCWTSTTNNLPIKSTVKLWSTAIEVCVAMSPRHLGGRHRCCPHPVAKVHVPLFCGRHSVFIELHLDWRHLHGDNIVDHEVFFQIESSVALCPFQQKWRVLHNFDISRLDQVRLGIA